MRTSELLLVRLNNYHVRSKSLRAEVFGLVSLPLSSGKIEYNASRLEVRVDKGSEATFDFISLNSECMVKV